MFLRIDQKGNTMDKTTDILRKFRAEEGGPKQVSAEDPKERFHWLLCMALESSASKTVAAGGIPSERATIEISTSGLDERNETHREP